MNALKNEIQAELDKINAKDLAAILQTPEGRRFFSWLLQKCGRDTQPFFGNSRDVFGMGTRYVSGMLIEAVKYMGLPGVDLLHVAEREYIALQEAIAHDIQKTQENRVNYKPALRSNKEERQ